MISLSCRQLLADKGLVLDRYDGTQATGNPTPQKPGLGVPDRSIRQFHPQSDEIPGTERNSAPPKHPRL